MGTRLLALFQFTECLYRSILLVNIHIAIVKDTDIQPGDNSQSISAISLGLQLKALSQIAEMIHCTWLYIIMAVVIMYYLFFFFFLNLLLACLWRWCRFFLYAFPASAKPLCSRATAALLHFGSASVLTVDFTAPSQNTDIRLNRTVSASLWQLLSFKFQNSAKISK